MTDFTKHKKGVTLVELIAAIAILSMVVIGTVTAVVLAQQAMLGDDLQENASLQAQQIADTLLEEMSGKSFADNADELTRYDPDLLNGAVYVGAGDFPEAKTVGGAQYTIREQSASAGMTSVTGTALTVAVYYSDTEYVTIDAFAPEITAEDA